MTGPYLKAAEIPDHVFMQAVRQVCALRQMDVADRWSVGLLLDGRPDLLEAGAWGQPYVGKTPQGVVLAKARKLIRRRAIDGCACGCRGDFEPLAADDA